MGDNTSGGEKKKNGNNNNESWDKKNKDTYLLGIEEKVNMNVK